MITGVHSQSVLTALMTPVVFRSGIDISIFLSLLTILSFNTYMHWVVSDINPIWHIVWTAPIYNWGNHAICFCMHPIFVKEKY
jgi:hypothetical protein